ncbi:hypothetical protein NDI85_20260 [Halomicroarcula sp. S1AR25-4]|jgi:hypothetical protein|uniref:Uncharacterized protein n=3 Tax=Halobacteriales TaxID=2235 RepID=A0A8J8P6X9_9EURY|nr:MULTISPECIES: hypothetical protein [Halobacteria]RDZ44552.1 hypothetical protein C5B87_10170 [Haloferax sp. Atlit-16N]RDZ53719.1 hypothetical protein C5B91_20455 [Haloferax sp. Atlit-10N]MDF9748114.1 hypothetical protein [Natrinema salsiterrestre]MDS0280121.1 hypothetical protein [Halomicroarcula sp. S1AR25-4]TQQ78432.1 hypothetical protein EGH24_14760 [Halonotius terrestris]
METMNTNGTTRQYGAAIALVSGVYSLLSATGGTGMMGSNSGLLMALLGVVVVVHGVVLLTPYADRLGNASGPLMIGYSLVMLLNQALVGVTGSVNWGMGSGMGSGMNGGMSGGMGSSMTAGMGWDLGMVALAVLMLISGVIMTNRRNDSTGM